MTVMTLRVSFLALPIAAFGAVLGWPGPVAAQQPQSPVAVMPNRPEVPTDTPQGGRQQRPLTEAEERERRIRAFDPKAPVDPRAGDRIPDIPSVSPDSPAPLLLPSPVVRETSKPMEGSVAASNQRQVNPRNAGPQVTDTTDGLEEEYTGPAVLTRAYTLQRPSLPQQIRWKYALGFQEVYDQGGRPLSGSDSNQSDVHIGQQFTWNISGRHYFKKDIIGLNYAGSYNKYGANSLTGSNHSMNGDFGHVLSRRLKFNLVASGSILTQGYTLQNPITNPTNSLANVNVAASPVVQIFDTETRQLQVNPSLQWTKSARVSMTAGGGWFAIERAGAGLTGQTGYQAQADMNYRLTRRTTVGTYYTATFYRYAHKVAVSDSHTSGLIFSASLDRSTQFRTRAGLTLFENRGLATVVIAPEIARLLGTAVGVVDQYRSNKYSEISAELARDFHRNRTAVMNYSRSLAPGNGLILASVQQSAGAGFNVRLLRRYQVSTGVGWTTLSSGVQTAGKYGAEYVFLGVSHPTGRHLSTDLRFDYRKFTITNAPPTPDQLRVSLGFSWSPGEGPLRLW